MSTRHDAPLGGQPPDTAHAAAPPSPDPLSRNSV
jgi:hypothetical protein